MIERSRKAEALPGTAHATNPAAARFCAGWTAHEIVAHVAGIANEVSGRVRGGPGDYAGACTCRTTQATWVRPGVLVADHACVAPGFTLAVVTILVPSTVSPGWVTKSTTIW